MIGFFWNLLRISERQWYTSILKSSNTREEIGASSINFQHLCDIIIDNNCIWTMLNAALDIRLAELYKSPIEKILMHEDDVTSTTV